MKKRIIVCVYVLMFIVCFMLAFKYIYNQHLISEYKDNDYSSDVDPLLFCNWVQPYLAHYNMGNIHYQNKEYQAAIEEYKTALEENPSEEQECSVRINLALAIIATMGADYDSEDKIQGSIEKLKEARDVLTEEGCATDNGDGHSETAEQLKKEIDDLLDELEENQPTEPDDGNGSNNDPQEKKDDDNYEKDVKDRLQQQQIDSYKERMEYLQYYEELDFEYNWDANGRVW